VYWVAGARPLGGKWRGREGVLDALWNREPGLGAADWGSEDVCRGDRICEMRDYTDSHVYEAFLRRHRNELPKFRDRK
jgi:hypothetical protein